MSIGIQTRRIDPVTTLKILACQVLIPQTVSKADRDAHVRRMVTKIDEILRQERVDLVALPELSTIDYSREAFSQLDGLAEELDDVSARAFGEVARRHGVALAFGMPRREGRKFYISQVVLGRDGGLLGHYDKIHIAQFGASMEKEYFQRGTHLLTFNVGSFKISPIICYDIRFPELLRALCDDQGTDVILHCGAYARDESYYSWHQFAVTRAMENMTYLLSLNRAGSFFGRSIFCPPWVDERHPEIVFPDEEVFRIVTLRRSELDEARRNYPFLRDRLSGYGELERDVAGAGTEVRLTP